MPQFLIRTFMQPSRTNMEAHMEAHGSKHGSTWKRTWKHVEANMEARGSKQSIVVDGLANFSGVSGCCGLGCLSEHGLLCKLLLLSFYYLLFFASDSLFVSCCSLF